MFSHRVGHYETNLRAIEAHRPELLSLAQSPLPTHLRTEKDASGVHWDLRDLRREAAWYGGDVERAIAETVRKAPLRKARLLALFGFGLGHELKAALALRSKRHTLIVEPEPEVFRAALEVTDLSSEFESRAIDWLVGANLSDLRLALHRLCNNARYLFALKSLAIVSPEAALARNPDYIPEAIRLFREATTSCLNLVGNDPRDTLLGLEHILQNLELITRHRSIWALEGLLAGRPAVVASTGPSLVEALPALRDVQDKLPVFCPDTSVPVLLEAGIRPHVAASRERVEKAIKHFEGVPSHDVVLACCPVLRPEIFKHHRGPVGFIYRSTDFHRWLQPEGPVFEFDGSAGNLAYRLAVLAGCDPIILVGQDLCFSPDGNTHAPGTKTGTRQPNFQKQEQHHIPGNQDEMVVSTPKWMGFLKRFEIDIATHPPRVINTTLGGAAIEGTEVMSLDRALAEASLADSPRPALLNAFAPASGPAVRGARDRLRAKIATTRSSILKMREVGQVGINFATLAQKSFSPPSVDRPDIDLLAQEKPYSTLDGVRRHFLSVENETFEAYVLPVVQPAVVNMELERYAAEFLEDDPGTLGQTFVEQYRHWFTEMDSLMSRAEALLDHGEKALAPARHKPSRKRPRRKQTKPGRVPAS